MSPTLKDAIDLIRVTFTEADGGENLKRLTTFLETMERNALVYGSDDAERLVLVALAMASLITTAQTYPDRGGP
jgi:hypothetical protein